MTFAAFIEVLTAFFKFPDAVTRLVKVLRATDQENHEKLVKQIEDESKQFEDTGRPQ